METTSLGTTKTYLLEHVWEPTNSEAQTFAVTCVLRIGKDCRHGCVCVCVRVCVCACVRVCVCVCALTIPFCIVLNGNHEEMDPISQKPSQVRSESDSAAPWRQVPRNAQTCALLTGLSAASTFPSHPSRRNPKSATSVPSTLPSHPGAFTQLPKSPRNTRFWLHDDAMHQIREAKS